jgi:hypothetical protein
MKHRVTAVVAVALLAAAAAVAIWIVFARSGTNEAAPAAPSSTASPRPTASPSPSFSVPAKRVDPLKGASYCATVKLLGVYAHQSYGLNPDLGLVNGRQFGRRLEVVSATYRRLALQAAKLSKAGPGAARSWRVLATTVAAAEQKLRVTGYDVQSQVMILELAEVAKATQTHLPKATATLTDACGVTRETIGL